MSKEREIGELVQRLEHLEHQLGERLRHLTGRLARHHHEEGERIKSRCQETRSRATDADDDTWDVVKHDVEADWTILNHSFERWVKDVDREYQTKS